MEERDSNGFYIIKSNYSDLYEKGTYRAPIDYCVNRIYEYDIRHANISMLRQKKYLPEETLRKLDMQPKQVRETTIGLMIRDQKKDGNSSKVEKIIKQGILKARRDLFMSNMIQSEEVLSIKNDAIFIIGRRLSKTEFGHVVFNRKNSFSAYHLINGVEFYFDGKTGKFTVKGIADEVIAHPDHEEGMLEFLEKVLRYLMLGRRDDLRKYLIEFSDLYKSRKLPHQYYREMNAENLYRSKNTISYKSGDNNTDIYFNYDVVNDDMVKDLNITFNYNFYVLPIIRLHM